MINDFNTDARYKLIQRLETGTYEWREENKNCYGLLIAVVAFLTGLGALPVIKSCDTEVTKPAKECTSCHNRQMSMTNYFRARKNPHPEAMAFAVLQTKNPKLLAAIAVKGEKNTPYTVRKGGWKGNHAGAFQMSEKYHGKQPHDPVGQALNAEKYLVELFDDMPPVQALNQYGGESDLKNGKYAQSVLNELVRVP